MHIGFILFDANISVLGSTHLNCGITHINIAGQTTRPACRVSVGLGRINGIKVVEAE